MTNIFDNVANQTEEFNPRFQRITRNLNRLKGEFNAISENPVIARRLYILIRRIESLIEKHALIMLNCRITKEVCNSWIGKKLDSQAKMQMLPSGDLAYMGNMFDYLGDIEKVLLISTYAQSTAKSLLRCAYELKDKNFTGEEAMIL